MSDAPRHLGDGFERAFDRVTIGGQRFPPIESPVWDATAEAIGEGLLHDRAQLPPVVLGRCETLCGVHVERCSAMGLLTIYEDTPLGGGTSRARDAFVCPAHGATLERAVRRYPP